MATKRKPLVAVVRMLVKERPAFRVYGVYTRKDELLESIEVADCNAGEQQAMDAIRERYTISRAEWTYHVGPLGTPAVISREKISNPRGKGFRFIHQKRQQKPETTKCSKCGERTDFRYSCGEQMRERKLCFSCNYWYEMKHADVTNRIVSKGRHFVMGPENAPHKGMDGRRYRIRKLDTGEIIETTNLWSQGTIPDVWLKDFPDNAEFLHEV